MSDPPNLPAPRPQINAGAPVAALIPRTLEEAYRLADAMARSGMTPSTIKTPEAVLVAIMAGAELGFPPFQALQSFAVINGRPSIFGDAIPALLWSRGFKIKEWLENEDPAYPDDMTARCEVTRPDGQVIAGEFSVADAKEAQLWSKTGPWQTAKKRMLRMRARAFAARDGAADVLRGFVLAEEAQDYTPIDDKAAGTGMVARLAARETPVDAPGFNVRKVTDETDAAHPPRAAKRRAKHDVEKEAEEPPAGTDTPHDPETGEVIDAEVAPPADIGTVLDGDDLPDALKLATEPDPEKTATEAPPAPAAPETPPEAPPPASASEVDGAATSKPQGDLLGEPDDPMVFKAEAERYLGLARTAAEVDGLRDQWVAEGKLAALKAASPTDWADLGDKITSARNTLKRQER